MKSLPKFRTSKGHRNGSESSTTLQTLAVAKGFTLHVVRAIMNGRGDEIIDLAKTNLWR